MGFSSYSLSQCSARRGVDAPLREALNQVSKAVVFTPCPPLDVILITCNPETLLFQQPGLEPVFKQLKGDWV